MNKVGEQRRTSADSDLSGGSAFVQYVASLWRELPGTEKKKYEDMAKDERKIYAKQRLVLIKGAMAMN